ncbi:homocystinuria type D homolog, mitochondrial [Seminavis robusta]|uniref:Homocystinuria type D homolog, mitochondrial n=1 Tax=Seminavis robusta TaxID=568900 RepID=A0A9N8DWX3_9STRA|nr:homocystinuria type D homolog, mitochondrial [Seminavis robusta]|eukprot:Sro426_g140300.1 homocystinuria type D homolog, mitochondrial (194) ;mRNA; r:9125-9903
MSTLMAPKLISKDSNSGDSLECSVHTLPKPLVREFHHVFAEKYLRQSSPATSSSTVVVPLDVLAIPTNQRARMDLVNVGDHVEQEKDRLLNTFIDFARDFCEKVLAQGYWADFIDPCSGLPMITTDCNKVYSEVDGMECLLHYKSHNAGFCKVLTHPKWGSAVYPATIFAYAPKQVVIRLLSEHYPAASEASN